MSRGLWVCVLATALARLAVLPVNENLYGDAVIRTELGLAWAEQLRPIRSASDGVHQFGPLHIALVGLSSLVVPDKALVGRLLSLLLGVASVFPLFFLTRRLFGERAATWAGLGFALWGLHIQLSTTAASEALGLLAALGAYAWFARALDHSSFTALVGSALCLNAACATRYDSWLLIPLFVALLFLGRWPVLGLPRFGGTGRTALGAAVLFGAVASLFPAWWLLSNWSLEGDPLAPIRMVSDFHRAWIADGLQRYGELGYRAQSLLFWPAVGLFTLSPVLAALGAVGAWRSFRTQPQHRWLLAVAFLPAAYFTVRAALVLDFVPLARFTVNQLVVLLPFAFLGWQQLGARGWLRDLAFALAVVAPLGLGLFTFRSEGKLQDALRPVSPTSTNPAAVHEAVVRIRAAEGPVLIDEDPQYLDLQVAFFSGLSEEQLLRVRWNEHGAAELAVTFDDGKLRPPPAGSVLYRGGGLSVVRPQGDAGPIRP